MGIRPAYRGDSGGIARVHVESWRTTYAALLPADYLAGLEAVSRPRWERFLADPELGATRFVYLAEESGAGIVGFVCGGRDRALSPDYEAELYAIYLLAPFQRGGRGRALFETLARRFVNVGWRSMRLWVAAANPATGFYERMGGVRVGERVERVGGVDLELVAYGWTDLGSLGWPRRSA